MSGTQDAADANAASDGRTGRPEERSPWGVLAKLADGDCPQADCSGDLRVGTHEGDEAVVCADCATPTVVLRGDPL